MKYIFFLLVLCAPAVVRADVIFSEIAWMGTVESQFEEWIELRNTGSESVSLTGWKIYKANGATLLFSLSGDISPGQYLVVCRTTPSVTTPLSGGCDLSGSFGGSGLNNISEHLVLKNGTGSTVEEVDAGGGWPAGNSSTKETMQKNGSLWITAFGTPREVNATSGTDDGNDDTTNPPPEEDDEEEEVEEEAESATSSTVASKTTKPTYTKRVVDIQVVDTSVPVGAPVMFSLHTRDLKGANIYKGDFFWNMGDGTERFYARNQKFEHIYEHPGTYIVYLKYYTTHFEDMEPDATDKVTITVTNPQVIISSVHVDGSIELKNTASQEIDMSNWLLKDMFGKTFSLPEGTYIAGNKTLVLNVKRTGLHGASTSLFGPSGNLVAGGVGASSVTPKTSSGGTLSRASLSRTSSNIADVEEIDSPVNLNDRAVANVSSSGPHQKQPSLWTVVFVCMLLGVSALVFFLYRKKEDNVKEPKEEDEFELID